jgi:hypothetical protein
MITRADFIKATGREPVQDDLERCNCMEAGTIGHLCCGWDRVANKPQFDVGPREWNGAFPRNSASQQ